jgi:uncharacterized membrane protein (UPF0127 family)
VEPLRPAALEVGASVRAGVGAPLRVAVARTLDQLQHGLMRRDTLGEVDGMLFVLARRGIHAFWMKDVRFALDIAWLDARGVVVDVAAGVPPCTGPPCPVYTPRAPATHVLEVPAGVLALRGIARGSVLSIVWE